MNWSQVQETVNQLQEKAPEFLSPDAAGAAMDMCQALPFSRQSSKKFQECSLRFPLHLSPARPKTAQ